MVRVGAGIRKPAKNGAKAPTSSSAGSARHQSAEDVKRGNKFRCNLPCVPLYSCLRRGGGGGAIVRHFVAETTTMIVIGIILGAFGIGFFLLAAVSRSQFMRFPFLRASRRGSPRSTAVPA